MVLVGLSLSRLGLGRRLRGGLLALVVTAVAVFAAPTPSMAAGDNYFISCDAAFSSCQTGKKVSSPAGVCGIASAYYGSTIVCVDYYGDYVYVKDNKADGYAAMAVIESDRGIAYRFCRNPHGNGSWAKCNFDWSEPAKKQVEGGILQNSVTMPLAILWSFSNN